MPSLALLPLPSRASPLTPISGDASNTTSSTTSSSALRSEKETGASINRRNQIPLLSNETAAGVGAVASSAVQGIPSQRVPVISLSSMPPYRTRANASGASDFRSGGEIDTNPDADSVLWDLYLKEAGRSDEVMIHGFRDTVNYVLVFAAIFSAVVATFIVQTSQAFQPNQAQITNELLLEQIIPLLRANGNSSEITKIPFPPTIRIDSRTYTNSDIWINVLGYTSLAISIGTALASGLVMQWLQVYVSPIAGDAKDRVLSHQLRLQSFHEWRLPEVVGLQPLFLHTSLGIFAIAFIVFIYNLNPSTAWTTVAVAVTGIMVYLGTLLLTAFAVDTPYKVPVLYRPIHSFFRLLQLGWFTLLIFLGQPRTKEVFHPSITAPSLRPIELTTRDSQEKRLALTMSALSWLHNVSVNRTVHRAIVESFAFLRPTSDDPQAWEPWVGRHRGSLEQLLSPSFLGTVWNHILPSSHSPTGDPLCGYATCGALMDTLEAFYRHGLVQMDYPSGVRDAMFRAVEYNTIRYTEFMLLERRVEVAGPVYGRSESGETLLEMAMRLGRVELATLLKQHGSTTRDEKRSVQVAPPTGMALDRGRASAKSHANSNGIVDRGKK